jgi:hypothetical protein
MLTFEATPVGGVAGIVEKLQVSGAASGTVGLKR